MFGYPFVMPPAVKPGAPAWLPSLAPSFTRTHLACVRCGVRADVDMDDVAAFLVAHGAHIREFLETLRPGPRPLWRSTR